MGSRTFESLGEPLPKRIHIVISRRKDYPLPEGCFLVSSLEEGLQLAYDRNEKEVFVIGGAQIYSLALPHADWLYLSFIHATFEVDAYFPQLNWDEWVLTQEQTYPSDEKNTYAFTFRKYKRKIL
jgi:dihydrofolate reductase